ncbi:Thioredoxin domain-containing protein 9 [Fukomys damarensis]|uniref:Thioredoxin domain-containing protein 9 n=1 Tax=Fukomys damarensis TaxID=885580 RepID=A0A091CYM1_FUKDA|nr:Thioredoxin domain-containing protein 9 [Fukomys damarensis]
MKAEAPIAMFSSLGEPAAVDCRTSGHLDLEIQKLDQRDEDELERFKDKRLEGLKLNSRRMASEKIGKTKAW